MRSRLGKNHDKALEEKIKCYLTEFHSNEIDAKETAVTYIEIISTKDKKFKIPEPILRGFNGKFHYVVFHDDQFIPNSKSVKFDASKFFPEREIGGVYDNTVELLLSVRSHSYN